MMYEVLKPFRANGLDFRRGQSVSAAQVSSWKNKDLLLRTEYIRPKVDPNTFRVQRPFVAAGREWKVGELIKNPNWKNIGSLLGAGYIQPTSLSEGAAPTAPSEIWKDKNWLKEQYVVRQRSPVAIAKEVGCSVGTLYHWLHKYNLKQPGWRPHSKVEG